MDKTIDRWTDPDGNGYAFKDTVARAQNRATIDKMNAETADRKAEVGIERKRIDNLVKDTTDNVVEYKADNFLMSCKSDAQASTTETALNVFKNISSKSENLGNFITISSDSKIQIKKSGLYSFDCKVQVTGVNASTGRQYARLKINDVQKNEYMISLVGETDEEFTNFIVSLNEDDTISFTGESDFDDTWITLYTTIHILDYDGKVKIPDITKEVSDIRVGEDGTVYSTAGEAVRKQIGNLTEDLGNSLGYKYYNIKPLWTNGRFYSRNGSLESDLHASYTEIEVKVGEKYHIVGYNAYHLSLYSLRDSNKNKITTYPDSSDTNYEKRKFDEYITIPEGVKYLCVSKWDNFGEMLVEKETYAKVTNIDAKVTDIDAKVTDIDAKVTDIDTAAIEKITEFYQIGNDTMEVGWVKTDKGVDDAGEASTARHLTINNIIGGDTYRYTANGGGNCHAVLWFDDTDSLISYVPFTNTWKQETVEVTGPTDAVKAIVNSNNTSKGELVFEHYGQVRIVKVNPIIEKRVADIEKRVAELGDETIDSFEYENIKKRVIENQIKNDFAWGEFDGLYATITFDDTNTDIDQLQDLAEELNIPFCYATIPSKLENITSQGTETAKQVLERAVANGGEVLSHWGPQLNSLSKDEDYYNVYAGAKKTLTENGFEVNGIITAGGGTDGTPESFKTQNFLKDIELARIYYKYADLTANDFVSGQDLRYIEQFYNNRTFTDGGVDATKSKIDVMALSGKGWLNLASHGTNNANTPTIDSFRQIFQYAKDKGFTFVTWNTMYEKFKSSKLEKRVKALEIN